MSDHVHPMTCDTCGASVIWHATFGYCHFENGATVPPRYDTSRHEVTVKRWSAAEEKRHAKDWFQGE